MCLGTLGNRTVISRPEHQDVEQQKITNFYTSEQVLGFSMFQLFLYYIKRGITFRFTMRAVQQDLFYPLNFTFRLFKWAVNGKLFRRCPNTLTALEDLEGYDRERKLLLVRVRDLMELRELMNQHGDENSSRGFLAISYCQRTKSCRLPRFSSECAKLSGGQLESCESCEVSKLVQLGRKLNLDINIVTDSIHAMNLLFEKLRSERGDIPFIITTCPLAARLIYAMAPLVRIRGVIIPLISNTCKDLKEFDEAERGYKTESTSVPEGTIQLLEDILTERS